MVPRSGCTLVSLEVPFKYEDTWVPGFLTTQVGFRMWRIDTHGASLNDRYDFCWALSWTVLKKLESMDVAIKSIGDIQKHIYAPVTIMIFGWSFQNEPLDDNIEKLFFPFENQAFTTRKHTLIT